MERSAKTALEIHRDCGGMKVSLISHTQEAENLLPFTKAQLVNCKQELLALQLYAGQGTPTWVKIHIEIIDKEIAKIRADSEAGIKRVSDAQCQENLFDVYEQVDRSYKQAGLI